MYSIDTIPMKDFGLYISNQNGQVDLLEPKEMFFTIYGNSGYQPTKRKANEVLVNGFIIADGLSDFITKTNELKDVFSASGTRSIELEASAMTCLVDSGFTITGVHIKSDSAFAKFSIKLTIV